MRNINTNKKGNTDVKSDIRIFDAKTASYNDSNKEWNDFQLYYDENQFQTKEKADTNVEATERGKSFVRGQLILMALHEDLDRKTHQRKLGLQRA